MGRLPSPVGVQTEDQGNNLATAGASLLGRHDKGRFTLRFHDLRREFGSQLIEVGAGIHEVRDRLGHSNVTMTSVYLVTTAQSLKQPFKKLGGSAPQAPARRVMTSRGTRMGRRRRS